MSVFLMQATKAQMWCMSGGYHRGGYESTMKEIWEEVGTCVGVCPHSSSLLWKRVCCFSGSTHPSKGTLPFSSIFFPELWGGTGASWSLLFIWDAGRGQSFLFLAKVFLWAIGSVLCFFPFLYTCVPVFGSSVPFSGWRTVFGEGWNSRLALHLWLMWGKVGDGNLNAWPTVFISNDLLYSGVVLDVRYLFNCDRLRKNLHVLNGWAVPAVLLLPSEMLPNRWLVKLLNRQSRQQTGLYPLIKNIRTLILEDCSKKIKLSS